MFTVKLMSAEKDRLELRFKNISCLRLRTTMIEIPVFPTKFKNISCLRLRNKL